MGRIGRKGRNAVFILLTSNWSETSEPKDLENRLVKKAVSDIAKATMSEFCDVN